MYADELTLREAAAALGITRSALHQRAYHGLMRGRLVPGVRGPMLVIPREEVERWKQARRVGSWLVPPEPVT
jgi:hypothetical protein